MLDNYAVCLSGGIDSTTVLALAARWPHDKMLAISFRYGSKHNQLELNAAKRVADSFGIAHRVLDMTEVFENFKSSMLDPDVPIPEGHYSDESMKSTVVPMRNLIFISAAAGYAVSYFDDNNNIQLGVGVHAGDHAIYPDCRPETIFPMVSAVSNASEGQVELWAPLLHADKAAIVEMGLMINAPYSLTRTCYNSELAACGKCGSCFERLEAFKANNVKDPIAYKGNYGS